MALSGKSGRQLSVCVVGAGCSGLTATKELLDEGHRVVCFERQARIGGNFDQPTGAAYDFMRLTVSQYFMAFSSFPPAEDEPRRFWTRREYLHYLERFVERFGLESHLRRGVDVQKIRRIPGKQFVVEYLANGTPGEETFDAVAVCQGAHRPTAPRMPVLAGQESFTGEILHSAAYKNPLPFVGKRVLCVGSGETAADVANQISQVAAACWISFRRYPSLLPRGGKNGFTSDAGSSRVQHAIARDLLNRRFLKKARLRVADPQTTPHARLIAEWRLKCGTPAHQFFQKSDDFVPAVLNGRLQVIASEIDSVDGPRINFTNGERVEADAIVCCTGYEESGVPDLFGGEPAVADVRSLFKHVFHPETGSRVAFIGWARPVQGGVPACAEMQSRYFALLCSGRRRLPAPGRMRAIIEQDRKREERMFYVHAHIKTLCLYTEYMDDLARLIGCRPRLWTYVFAPSFLLRLIFGSNIAPQYRLRGPHSNPAVAKRVIMSLPALPKPASARVRLLGLAAYSRCRSLILGS